MKIWATDLDRPAWWRHKDMTSAEMLADLERDEETEAMAVGSAFHAAMEEWDGAGLLVGDGITFSAPMGLPLCHSRETRVTFRSRGGHLVTGRVDGMIHQEDQGWVRLGIVDWKTTTRAIRLADYTDCRQVGREAVYARRWQWRVYLAAFPAAYFFRYHAVRLQRVNAERWLVTDDNHIDFPRYRGLEEDVEGAVDRFATLAGRLGWEGRQ